ADQARRLAGLIDELSDLTRLRTGKLTLRTQKVDLGQLAQHTVDIARSLADGREIALEVPRRDLTVQGDPGRLEQVLMNLLNNALAHTRPNDHIELRVRQAGRWAEVQVSDSGPGIPEAELPNLFTRYYQVGHEQGAGLGLGLFIVKQFVEAHGGDVTVDSKLGQGTMFS